MWCLVHKCNRWLMLMLDLAVKTNPIHLFSIIMKLHVFWTLGQNKNQKFNPFVFSSFKVWQSTWSTQSYVHININSKVVFFPIRVMRFFCNMSVNCFQFAPYEWKHFIALIHGIQVTYCTVLKFIVNFIKGILECLKLHNIVQGC